MGWCPICKKNVQVEMKMGGIIGRRCRHIIHINFVNPTKVKKIVKTHCLRNRPKWANTCVCGHFRWKHELKSDHGSPALFYLSTLHCLNKKCACPEFTLNRLKYIENITKGDKSGVI